MNPRLMWRWLAAPLAGGLLVLVFPGFGLVWLAPVALAVLLAAVAAEPRPSRRFLLGWLAGVAYWFGVCYWIQFVMAVHGGLGALGGWAVFVLFCFVKALHMAVFAYLAGTLMRRAWAIPAVAALWVAVEVTHAPLGFAWLALGNAAIDMGIPLRLAPYTGVYGVSFVLAMLAAGLALALLRRPRVQLAPLAALPLLLLLPALPSAEPGDTTAVLLQPALPENAEWTRSSLDAKVREMAEASVRAALSNAGQPAKLIVWPEVPAPLYFDEDPGFRAAIVGMARTARAQVLLGVVAHTPAGAPLNSATMVSPAGQALSRYDKVNLVPFGEFVPWPFGFAKKISTEIGDFAPGRDVVVSPLGDHLAGTFICYESVFPDFVRRFAARGAEVLINISNDGWFGRSAAREQHLLIARMRAVENRRWILRSTNDGVSASIDTAGRVRESLPPYVAAALRPGFRYHAERTLYTRYGDWFPLLCAVASGGMLLWGRRARS